MPTYRLISSYTVSSGGITQISFTSIPQTYTDLVIKASLRGGSENTTYIELGFNGATTNISSRNFNALSGSGVASYNYASDLLDIAGQNVGSWAASTFSCVEYTITNYTLGVHKVVSMDSFSGNTGATAYMAFTSGKYASNTAITSVQLIASGGTNSDTFATSSTAYLYGIQSS